MDFSIKRNGLRGSHCSSEEHWKKRWNVSLIMPQALTVLSNMPDCFDIYDLNSDGYITREEMFHMLKNTLIKVDINIKWSLS